MQPRWGRRINNANPGWREARPRALRFNPVGVKNFTIEKCWFARNRQQCSLRLSKTESARNCSPGSTRTHARSTLAAHPRPVPHLGQRGHAAADHGRGGDPVLRSLPRPHFPTVHALAAADEQQVLKLWEGLGYYRRARHLHAAAKTIVADIGGVFPRRPGGVGRRCPASAGTSSARCCRRRSTAGCRSSRRTACACWPGCSATAATRAPATATKWIWQAAESVLPQKRVGDFNQAMMELGAMVCTPKRPEVRTVPGCRRECGEPRRTAGPHPAAQETVDGHRSERSGGRDPPRRHGARRPRPADAAALGEHVGVPARRVG